MQGIERSIALSTGVCRMTARNQPHKFRCETCEYQSKSDYIAGSGYCLKSKKGYLTSSNNRGFTLEEYTSALGCTSHSDATKAESHGRLKCPKCNGPVFIANIDDVDTILCYDDTCKWKQKIVAEPAERRIADVIEELENSIKTGSEIRLDKLIKKLRGELV